MVWRIDDPQGNESGKVKYEIVPFTRGRGLDIGCGPYKAFPHFIGVDSGKDTELFGTQMRPDLVTDCSDLSLFSDGSMDFVFSSHLLEHLDDYQAALHEWWRVTKLGGHMVLYLPHRDLYPNIGQDGANPDHKHDFVPDDIIEAMRSVGTESLGPIGFDVLVNEVRDAGNEYSFLLVLQKIKGAKERASYLTQKPKKCVCVCRYGGFGDMLQAAAVFPELKRQGYHVTVMTTPKGRDIIKDDPHVDAWFIQDQDQVPNQELVDFWRANAKKWDRFVNLSESVEGTLLAMPGRANHAWPWDVRHAVMNRNYGEWTAQLSGVPFKPDGRFYPTDDEYNGALSYLRAIGAEHSYIILYALSGSSRHKFYPGQDDVLQAVLAQCQQAFVVMVGDYACKILEAGWEDHARVATESGELPIRSVLALAQHAHAVIGPETGVLNSVAYDASVYKIVLLSHSSRENLTKNWVNARAIEPRDTPCYPCHQLHYNGEHCPSDKETGAAVCQRSIDPDRVSKPLIDAYERWSLIQKAA